MLAIDTETALIAPRLKAPPLACLTASDGSIDSIYHHSSPQLFDVVTSAPAIVGHYFAFDACVLMAHDPVYIGPIFDLYEADKVTDTGIRQKLLDIAAGTYLPPSKRKGKWGYSLADVHARYFGALAKPEQIRLSFGQLRDVPLEQWPSAAREYALEDARAPWNVWRAQEQWAHVLTNQYRQTRSELWLALISAWGMHTSGPRVKLLKARVEALRDKAIVGLITAGLVRKNGSRDTKAAMARIVAAYGGNPPMTEGGEKKGPQPSLSRESCQNSGDPLLADYAEIQTLNAFLDTNVPMLAQGVTDPIHPRFETIVNSGRTSSHQDEDGDGGNTQNMRRKNFGGLGMRECFEPRPGTAYLCADYGGLELCTLAEVCIQRVGYSALADALNKDLDPHIMIAADILGEPYELLEAIQKGPHEGRWSEVNDARQVGKVVNFGCPGGLGPDSLVHYAKQSYGVTLSREKAKWLRDVWRARWPEMPGYFDYINSISNGAKVIEQVFSGRWRGNVGFCDACNTLFQGLGADVAKDSGWRIIRECYEPGTVLYGCRQVNFVHDEHVLEVPTDRVHEVGERVEYHMLEAGRKWLPHVKMKVEILATSIYGKKAERRIEGGRLVVHHPKAA